VVCLAVDLLTQRRDCRAVSHEDRGLLVEAAAPAVVDPASLQVPLQQGADRGQR